MRSGEVSRWSLDVTPGGGEGTVSSTPVTRVSHACRLTPTSSGSHPAGWLLADLGSFNVVDHDRGRVLWMTAGGGVETVLGGLSRVVEVQPWPAGGGFVVAEFGWRATGALRLVPADGGAATILDARHGALGVPVADLDADGRDDIVAAFAQEHETVDVYWGSDGGDVERETIHRFPDPSWGSSGFEITDLDADGRLDILHTNGDMMDSGIAKPYHGVRWLPNEGGRAFTCHELIRMPAASQASAADLDGDGDLDVVVSALHPWATGSPAGTFAALLWLEQRPGGEFAPHTIALDRCDHASFTVADVDRDGRSDVVAGVWRPDEKGLAEAPLRVWINRPGSAKNRSAVVQSGRKGPGIGELPIPARDGERPRCSARLVAALPTPSAGGPAVATSRRAGFPLLFSAAIPCVPGGDVDILSQLRVGSGGTECADKRASAVVSGFSHFFSADASSSSLVRESSGASHDP
jgi:hypothetical protein